MLLGFEGTPVNKYISSPVSLELIGRCGRKTDEDQPVTFTTDEPPVESRPEHTPQRGWGEEKEEHGHASSQFTQMSQATSWE